MFEKFKKTVCEANVKFYESGLDDFSLGGISFIDRRHKIVIFRPLLPYCQMNYEKMLVYSLDGEALCDGEFDLPADCEYHLALYKSLPFVNAVAHITAPDVAAWAQAGRNIPAYGKIHTEIFGGDILCFDGPDAESFAQNINNSFSSGDFSGVSNGAVLLSNDSGFVFSESIDGAVEYSRYLNSVSSLALKTEILSSLAED